MRSSGRRFWEGHVRFGYAPTVLALSVILALEPGTAGSVYGRETTPNVIIDICNFETPYFTTGDVFAEVNNPTPVNATDVLFTARASVGLGSPRPVMDINGSGDEFGNHSVTATDTLMILRLAMRLPIPDEIFDIEKTRNQMILWLMHQQSLNSWGLIEETINGRRVVRTRTQAEAGIAMLAVHYRFLQNLLFEKEFTKRALIEAILHLHTFYFDLYKADMMDGTFDGFAEYYDAQTGAPIYDLGSGGNLTEDTAYMLAFITQEIGLLTYELPVEGRPDPIDMAIDLSRWFETPELERADGGVRFGIDHSGPVLQAYPYARTISNLAIRESLVTLLYLLENLSISTDSERLIEQIFTMSDFLRNSLWDNTLHGYVAEIQDSGATDNRLFMEAFGLAAMSQVSLPGGDGYAEFLVGTDVYRAVHPWDLDSTVMIDGYGTLDDSGVQNRNTLMAAFGYNMLVSRQDSPGLYGTPIWKWVHFIREIGKAIIKTDGIGAGIADACSSNDSGYGFVWDSANISASATAWWIMTTLDFHPFVAQFEGLAHFSAGRRF